MAEQKNIIQRMLAIQSEMETVAKNLKVVTNTKSGNGYKAVSERDVKDAVKPLEEKHGVYSYAVNSELVESAILVDQKDGYERKSQFMRIKETYRFVNTDNPAEYIENSAFGDGVDTGDKAPGKADTYAGKYALMKAYKISTGDDPDQDASPEKGYTKKTKEMTGKATDKQVSLLEDLYNDDELEKIMAHYKIEDLSQLDKAVASQYIENRMKGKKS